MRQLWCVRADRFFMPCNLGGGLVQGDQEMRVACAWRICLMFSAEESRFLPCGHCEACEHGGSSVRACALRHRRLGVIVEVIGNL